MTAGERGGDGECMVRDDSNGRSGSEGLLKVLRKEARESLYVCVCLSLKRLPARENERERKSCHGYWGPCVCLRLMCSETLSLAFSLSLSLWMRETGTHFSAIHPFPLRLSSIGEVCARFASFPCSLASLPHTSRNMSTLLALLPPSPSLLSLPETRYSDENTDSFSFSLLRLL